MLGLCIGLLLVCRNAVALESEDAVQAAFLYNFIGFVQWPQSVKPKGSSTVICVMGEDVPVMAYLEQLISRAPASTKIETRAKGRDSRISDCHILYISEHSKGDIDYVIGKSRDEPILTVSNAKDFVHQGGLVGFVMKGGQVKLEANMAAVKEAGLVIDSELLELMTIVQ